MTTSNDLLALLYVTPDSSEEHVLKLLIELGAQVVDASEGSLLVYDRRRNDLAFAMTVGGSPVLIGQRVPVNQGLTGLAAATREVQIGAPTFKVNQGPSDGSPSSTGPEAVIAAPMLVNDDLVGVITAVTFAPGKRFTSRDGELYGRLASVAGVVIEQRRKLKAIAEQVPAEAAIDPVVAAALARISRHGPHALHRAASILVHIEALAASRKE